MRDNILDAYRYIESAHAMIETWEREPSLPRRYQPDTMATLLEGIKLQLDHAKVLIEKTVTGGEAS
jgi:hypothetical protein